MKVLAILVKKILRSAWVKNSLEINPKFLMGSRFLVGGGGFGLKICIHCYLRIHPPPANDQAVCRVKDDYGKKGNTE